MNSNHLNTPLGSPSVASGTEITPEPPAASISVDISNLQISKSILRTFSTSDLGNSSIPDPRVSIEARYLSDDPPLTLFTEIRVDQDTCEFVRHCVFPKSNLIDLFIIRVLNVTKKNIDGNQNDKAKVLGAAKISRQELAFAKDSVDLALLNSEGSAAVGTLHISYRSIDRSFQFKVRAEELDAGSVWDPVDPYFRIFRHEFDSDTLTPIYESDIILNSKNGTWDTITLPFHRLVSGNLTPVDQKLTFIFYDFEQERTCEVGSFTTNLDQIMGPNSPTYSLFSTNIKKKKKRPIGIIQITDSKYYEHLPEPRISVTNSYNDIPQDSSSTTSNTSAAKSLTATLTEQFDATVITSPSENVDEDEVPSELSRSFSADSSNLKSARNRSPSPNYVTSSASPPIADHEGYSAGNSSVNRGGQGPNGTGSNGSGSGNFDEIEESSENQQGQGENDDPNVVFTPINRSYNFDDLINNKKSKSERESRDPLPRSATIYSIQPKTNKNPTLPRYDSSPNMEPQGGPVPGSGSGPQRKNVLQHLESLNPIKLAKKASKAAQAASTKNPVSGTFKAVQSAFKVQKPIPKATKKRKPEDTQTDAIETLFYKAPNEVVWKQWVEENYAVVVVSIAFVIFLFLWWLFPGPIGDMLKSLLFALLLFIWTIKGDIET